MMERFGVHCICDWVNNEGLTKVPRPLGSNWLESANYLSTLAAIVCKIPWKQRLKGKLKCEVYISNKTSKKW